VTERPAYYARRGGALADCWTLLHPPYTLWHLSYVVLGAAIAPHVAWTPLLLSVLAFFLAVGIAAHALDELTGHPLGTAFSERALVLAATAALLGAVALGAYGAFWWDGPNWALVVAVPVGAPPTCAELAALADDIVCARMPEPFSAVGLWYHDFSQTTDEEVQTLLREHARRVVPGKTARD